MPVNRSGAANKMAPSCNRSVPSVFSWERGHLGRNFGGRDARAPRGSKRLPPSLQATAHIKGSGFVFPRVLIAVLHGL